MQPHAEFACRSRAFTPPTTATECEVADLSLIPGGTTYAVGETMHAFAGPSLIGAKKQRGVTAITLIKGKSIREVAATQRVPS